MSSESRESRSAGRVQRVLSMSQAERARAPCAPGDVVVCTSYTSRPGSQLRRVQSCCLEEATAHVGTVAGPSSGQGTS